MGSATYLNICSIQYIKNKFDIAHTWLVELGFKVALHDVDDQRLSGELLYSTYIHCVSKKLPTFKLSVTSSNLNRFPKFVHCWKAYEISYKNRMTLPTSPKACCYTTLRN